MTWVGLALWLFATVVGWITAFALLREHLGWALLVLGAALCSGAVWFSVLLDVVDLGAMGVQRA